MSRLDGMRVVMRAIWHLQRQSTALAPVEFQQANRDAIATLCKLAEQLFFLDRTMHTMEAVQPEKIHRVETSKDELFVREET